MRYGRPDWDRNGPPDIPDEVPVLLLLGTDPAAPDAARAYADAAERMGASSRLVASVRRHAEAMEAYQERAGAKFPDL